MKSIAVSALLACSFSGAQAFWGNKNKKEDTTENYSGDLFGNQDNFGLNLDTTNIGIGDYNPFSIGTLGNNDFNNQF